MASSQVQSPQKRTWTVVIQGWCGLVAITCGIALFLSKADGPYIPYHVEIYSRSVANTGYGIWGGVIIAATAITGIIYREKKTMITIYAAFSLVSTVVAFILFSVAVTGLARFASLNDSPCQNVDSEVGLYSYYNAYAYDYDGEPRCCFERYYCDDRLSYSSFYFNYYSLNAPIRDPLNDYDSEECQNIREKARERVEEEREAKEEIRESDEERCREEIRETRTANLCVFASLLLVSVIELAVSITAAVLSFIVACRECCTYPTQQAYSTFPPYGQPGSAPMVYAASMAPGPPQMTGVAPNTLPPPYSPQMTVMNPNMSPGMYPYFIPAVNQGYDPGNHVVTRMPTGINNAAAAGANQWQNDPPPEYEPVAANI